MNLTKILKSSIVLIVLIGVNFSVSRAQTSRKVTVKNFSGVTVSSGIDLYLTQGSTESVNITGNAEVIENVIVEQSGNNVVIKYKSGMNWSSLFNNEAIKVYLNYKTLQSVSASGGSDVFTVNTMKAQVLNLTASGGSDLKLSLACQDLTLSVSGGSDAALKGSGENLKINASGGSDVDAFDYIVNFAKAQVTGGSDANIYVNKGLEAGASGGSDINYKGNAYLKKTSNSKSGDINHIK